MTSPSEFDLSELASPELKRHAESMLSHLRGCIDAAGGWLSFERYMHEALYAPGLGYYVAGKRKFGAQGDFITAPELGELFAGCMARQCEQVLAQVSPHSAGEVLEFGAGSGALALGVLKSLAELDALPERYLILEVSPDLRALQRERLHDELGAELSAKVAWLDTLPSNFNGVMLANEVLDAMPVKRFRYISDSQIEEIGVAWNDGLIEASRPATAELGAQVLALKGEVAWPAGYASEYCPQAAAWLTSLAMSLQQGAVLLMDYGFPQHEFYHFERAQGTVMCHSQHRAHPDALWLPGLQDITAHVNFSQLAEAGVAAGLQLEGFTHQAAFLMNLGLLEQISMDADMQTQLQLSAEIKKLTLPHEMGELFKAIGFSKGLSSDGLDGFSRNGQTGRL